MKETLFLFLFFSFFKITSQVIVSGQIKNKNINLSNVNIIAKPVTKEAKFTYTITDDNGNYQLSLTDNATYLITISHIGYITLKETVLVGGSNLIKNFNLIEDPNELQEVIINYKEPIKVRKDTTTYRADAFVNGKERKLRQVLKKLPGVEVDRKGNVTVKGKKVTTVLVENKEFFTGDTKLAVNNLPAEVIDEIQVIEDYHESDLLKGLETSEDVALNINLKKDKKKFIFGDLEVGGGSKDRYVFHPTVFKYTKKVSYSFIGDANNIGEKSFTLKDYINYEGGFDLKSFSSVFNSPMVRLLNERDFNNNKHLFGGLNLQLSTNEKNDWSAFVIGLKDKTNSAENLYQDYFIDGIQENRNTATSKQQNMLLGKIQLKSKPNQDVRVKFENRIELSTASAISNTESNLTTQNLNYSTNDKIDNLTLKSNLKIEKKFSKYHTSQAKINLRFSKTEENQNWFSTENIFSSSIPIQNNNNIDLIQDMNLKTYQINTLLKHFWIINPQNHLYAGVNNEVVVNSFKGNLIQKTDSIVNFNDFQNDNSNKELYLKFFTEYKRLLGDAFLTIKLEYFNYNRFNNQFGIKNTNSFKKILPSINFEWDLDNNRKVVFDYRLSNKTPLFSQLNKNRKLAGFNNILVGNINLRESNYHFFRLSYRKSRTYGWSFYPSINYRIRTNRIQNTFISNGLYFENTPVNLTNPIKEFSSNFKLVYNYKYWKSSLNLDYRNNNYYSLLNNDELKAVENTYYAKLNLKTVYIKGPNIETSLSQVYNENSNLFFNSSYSRTKFDFAVDYEIGNWIFKAENFLDYYNNNILNTRNSLNQFNASVFYQKEESPWGFEIRANNILNNVERVDSVFSDILFRENTTAIFPRVIVGKIIYKL